MSARAFWASHLLFLVGCSHNYTIHPTVLLDDSFTPDEMTCVKAAMSEWSSETPATFYTRIVSHADLAGGKMNGTADVIMYRMTSQTDPSCPTQGQGEPDPSYDADTFYPNRDDSVMCLDSTRMTWENANVFGGTYLGTIVHEWGHVFGLQHVVATPESPAVMYGVMGAPQSAANLTCTDLAQFADLHPDEYTLPAGCKGTTYQLSHR